MPQKYRYYIGSSGPQVYRSKNGELPFRVEAVSDGLEGGNIQDVSLAVTSVGGSVAGGLTLGVTISDFSIFRSAHFNSFNIAGDLL